MVSSCYVATASGYLIQADYIAYTKYEGDEEMPLFYEADTRTWYEQAVEAEPGTIIYTDAMEDIHEGGACIVCAKAIWEEETGELLAVAGVGSYLDTISQVVLNTAVGDTGYAVLVNEKGQVIVSPKSDGDTKVSIENPNAFGESSEAVAAIINEMGQEKSGLSRLILDGKEVCLAYTPLHHFGWSLVVVMDVEEVLAPARESNQAILALTEETENAQKDTLFFTAAMFMIMAKTLLRSKLQEGKSLAEVAQSVNNTLCGNNDNGMFVTAWFGVLSIPTGRVRAVNAGHCYPIIRHKDGMTEYITKISGMVLAGLYDMSYEEYEIQLMKGDTILLYTDGVTEAADEQGLLYGEEKLKMLVEQWEYNKGTLSKKEHTTDETPVNENQQLSYEAALLRKISKEIKKHQNTAPQADDITMLALGWNGYSYETYPFQPLMAKTSDASVFLNQSMKKHQVSYDDRADLLTVADEIFSNICYYSGAKEAAVGIYVEAEKKVVLYFEDDGMEYNPLKRKEPDVRQPLSLRPIGGLGIFLAKKLTDYSMYEYAQGKNCLILVKYMNKNGEQMENSFEPA